MYKIVSKYGAGRVFCLAVIIMSFVGCVAWQMSCPRCSDDYIYASAPVGGIYDDEEFWTCAGGEYRDLDEVWMTIKGHFSVTNSRISNHLYIVAQLLPLHVVKLICGIILGLMYMMLLKFSLPEGMRSRPLYVGLYTALFWIVFPWYDILQASVFVFNYPLSAVIILCFLRLYRNIGRYGAIGRVGLVVLAFLCGMYHEGFTIPLGAYVFADLAYRWREGGRVSLWRMAILMTLIVAVCVMWRFGSGNRLTHFGFSFSAMMMWFRWNAMKMFASSFPGLLMIAICVYDYFAKSRSRKALIEKVAPSAFAYFAGLFMCFVLNFYDRAMWGAYVFLVAAVMQACALADIKKIEWRGISAGVGGLLVVLYGLWLMELVKWQRRVTAVDSILVGQLAPRNSHFAEVAYADRVGRDDIPFYMMDIPCPVEEIYHYNNKIFVRYWVDASSNRLLVLPESLRGVPFDSLPAYPGNSGFRGVWPFIIAEKPIKEKVELRGGEFNGNQNPLMELAAGVRGCLFDSPAEVIHPYIEMDSLVMPDSTVVYAALVTRLPLTFRYRAILRVDTLDRR